MSEGGRYLETDKTVLGVWKRLTTSFSTSSLALTAAFGFRSIFPYHKDNLGLMLKTSRWKTGLGLLGGLSDRQIDFLAEYADINAGRVERVFRFFALAFVSVPVGSLVALNEVWPEVFTMAEFSFVSAFIAIIAGWLFFTAIMVGSSWRANDLRDLVRFEQARRLYALAGENEGEQ